jgi:hypothetical protein
MRTADNADVADMEGNADCGVLTFRVTPAFPPTPFIIRVIRDIRGLLSII